jgi:hypothetical protein
MTDIFRAAQELVLGGCRHKKMSWPIRLEGCSYRVCLDCGIKRIFDEETLRGYGPYSYHTNELLHTTARLNRSKVVIRRPARGHNLPQPGISADAAF